MTKRETVTVDQLIDKAYESGAVIERDPDTERLTLVSGGVRYVADGAA